MSTLSLKDRIVKYIMRKHGWVSGGEIQRIVMEHTKHLPRTAVRRLQEAVEEGKLEVRYTGAHNHAEYRIREGVIIPLQKPLKSPQNDGKVWVRGLGYIPDYSELEEKGIV